MDVAKKMKLIITIVTIEKSEQIFNALQREGVTKSTIISARGKSDLNPKWVLGIPIEPQRDCILTLVHAEKAEHIFEVIMREGELEKPLHGLVFMIDVDKIGGIDLSFFADSLG